MKTVSGEASLRLVLEFVRADHPRLFDDLIRFPKGARRINRLRLLAYDGLLAQSEQLAVPTAFLQKPIGIKPTPEDQMRAEEGRAAITNAVFSTDDDVDA